MADVSSPSGRPPNWPTVQPRSTPATAAPARSAAQAAFFQAALGGQSVPAQPAPQAAQIRTAPPVRMARAPDLTIQMPKEEPARILRPGSIINIVV